MGIAEESSSPRKETGFAQAASKSRTKKLGVPKLKSGTRILSFPFVTYGLEKQKVPARHNADTFEFFFK
jgi:hypothetical protein